MVTPVVYARKWAICGLLLLAVLAFQWTEFALPARADDGIQVVINSCQVRFASDITFSLEVSASAPIREVTLYYQQVGQGLRVKVPISSMQGRTYQHIWKLQPGDIPVGAHLEYWWRIVDSAGDEYTTARAGFEYADDRFAWKSITADNITLWWYGSNQTQAERLLGYALQSLDRLQDDMGVTVEQEIAVYVYQSKSDMSQALPGKSEAYDERILTLGVVVDDATLLILGSHSDVEQTMAHELSHVVVGLATDNPYAELPRWLDEGLAMVSEGKLPNGNRQALEVAIRSDSLISVRSLSGYTGDPDQVDLFYGEVYSLVSYMLETFGPQKMAELLAAIHDGQYQEDALVAVYGFGLEVLDAGWRQSLGLQTRQVSAEATQTPTPRPTQRDPNPCSGALLGVFLGVSAWVGRKCNAGVA